MEIIVELRDIDPVTGLDLDVKRAFADFFEPSDGIDAVGDMEANLHISQTGESYFVTGKTSGTVRLECGRCLKEYEYPLEVKLGATFLPVGEGGVGDEIIDVDSYVYENDKLEVSTLIRDNMIFAIPLKQLCKEECKGLCPKCGIDRNESSCECPEREVDARLSVLQKLKDKLEN